MTKITVKSLAKGSGPLRIGNEMWVGVSVMPTREQWYRHRPKVLDVAIQNCQRLLGDFTRDYLEKVYLLVWQSLTICFAEAMWTGREPAWIHSLPKCFQYALRSDYATFHEHLDGNRQIRICLNNRFHGFGGYVIREDGILHGAEILGINRLSGIKQLAFLHCPNFDKSQSNAHMRFDHTRLLHSLDVGVMMELIIRNNWEVLGPHRDLLMTAAIAHDLFTPAGGDTTKGVDPDAFDEDAIFPRLFKTEQWKRYRAEHPSVQEDQLAELILGKGPFGVVLDLADKTAYIGRDFSKYLDWAKYNGPRLYPEVYERMKGIADRCPNVAALWQYAEYVDGKVVITNSRVLRDFLLLRVLMFKHLYYNPLARFLEYVIGQILIKYLYDTKEISAEDLLTYDDGWLTELLYEKFGYFLPHFEYDGTPMELVSTEEEVERFRARFVDDPTKLVVIDRFNLIPKPATDRFFVRKGGKILSFEEAHPKWAEEIKREAVMDARMACYALDITHPRFDKIVPIVKGLV